ncbi:hypothetical protein ACTG16_22855 [Aeromonas sp. 23P]|uniref:hypothetical protein n=1 Tax=Aeromonas sp. 23P TaxID=3452716 RepID=UPI003F7AEB6F
MLGKNDVFPMIVNICLIFGGVALFLVAGTMPEPQLKDYVDDAAIFLSDYMTLFIQSVIFILFAKISYSHYNGGKKYLCIGLVIFGLGLVILGQFVLHPFFVEWANTSGTTFIKMIKAMSA